MQPLAIAPANPPPCEQGASALARTALLRSRPGLWGEWLPEPVWNNSSFACCVALRVLRAVSRAARRFACCVPFRVLRAVSRAPACRFVCPLRRDRSHSAPSVPRYAAESSSCALPRTQIETPSNSPNASEGEQRSKPDCFIYSLFGGA